MARAPPSTTVTSHAIETGLLEFPLDLLERVAAETAYSVNAFIFVWESLTRAGCIKEAGTADGAGCAVAAGFFWVFCATTSDYVPRTKSSIAKANPANITLRMAIPSKVHETKRSMLRLSMGGNFTDCFG